MTQKQRPRQRARPTVVALGALAALVVAAIPVGATVIDRGQYSDSGFFSYNDCGFRVEVTSEFSGVYRIRQGKNRNSSAFFLMDNFSYRDVHTNPKTGEWVIIRGNGVFNETKAERVEGSIFKFRSIEAGQPFVMEDSSGEIIFRDRGVIRRTILFDTEGDDQPGGTEIEILEEKVSGPHPAFFTDLCEVIRDTIG